MPAETEKQRRAMCLALQVKLGKRSKESVRPDIRKMAETMSIEDLRDYCKSSVKG